MRSSRRSTQRGTTLLEAMAAIVVLMIGALGVVATHNLGLKMNSDARGMLRATAIAQDMVENIGLWAWDDARLAVGAHSETELTAANWRGLSRAEIEDGQPFTRSWTVSLVDDPDGSGQQNAKLVAVNVGGANVTMYTMVHRK